eukprot:m.17993 g.17993  ORF g.17993 m.17993 type:complete len:683 (+) comp8403_c0_seq1:65-2113(+)
MGLLSQGTPLAWQDVKKHADYIREHGILQLINIFERLDGRTNDVLKWGDEVECMVVQFDDEAKTAKLVLRGKEFLEQLQEVARTWPETDAGTVTWHPEFGRYMIESTPGGPYGAHLEDFLKVEKNMALRRAQAKAALPPDVHMLSLTVFPRLGCPHFTIPDTTPNPGGNVSKSLFFPDDAINQHPRFAALARNIRERRGRKVAMNVPIFRDVNTLSPFVEDYGEKVEGDPEGGEAALPDHVYMDAMGFGMGNSCLQVTFQATSLEEATNLYDQLAVVCPIALALSAASPIYRGLLSDVDCRWNIISGSVDCRTRQEMGEEPLTTDKFVISKSRYASISSYLSQSELNLPAYQDIPLEIDEDIYQKLKEANFSEPLARHFAHLFIRDPIVVYEELLHQDDTKSTDHFENLQSTNWQTMRFKPPPVESDIGWRVEFRPCEVQMSDFENAAYTVFIVLLTRTILSFNLNLYMPLSKVDENMETAQKRDALRTERFWFPQCVAGNPREPLFEDDDTTDDDYGEEAFEESPRCCAPDEELVRGSAELPMEDDVNTTGRSSASSKCKEEINPAPLFLLTIDEIINGKPEVFAGLLPLIRKYIKSMSPDIDTSFRLNAYLNFIGARASGKVATTAQWIREFVQNHPDYNHDSVITDRINYDLLKRIHEITEGAADPGLLGDYRKQCAAC